VRWRGTCYRAHVPVFAFDPLSGEGARLSGGRFNAVGVPALYLSLSLETMILEQGHGFSRRLTPITICSYRVDAEDIVDLRTQELAAEARIDFTGLGCAWKNEYDARRTPASWAIAEKMIREGAAGILVPSFAVGAREDMSNLVLWKWGPALPHRVEVHDPDDQLPKDTSSWKSTP
jgi:RES domain-containing protein